MSSVRYFNQSAPFWDFVADFEQQAATHPWFANRAANRNADRGVVESESEQEGPQTHDPWTAGWGGFPFGPIPHRGAGPWGRRGGRGPNARRQPPQDPANRPADQAENEGTPDASEEEMDLAEGPPDPVGPPPPPFSEEPHHGHGHGPAGRGRGRGGFGGRGRGGRMHAHGHGHGPGHGHGRGPGGRGRGPFGGMRGFANMFNEQLFGENGKDQNEDFKPEVDVFDTPEAFVVHASLPGAKKNDIDVSWDAEKSELSIAGVVHRPGSEKLLSNLALDERKIGAFERKIRLGSRAVPAQVDANGISARMEDGVLRVEVPKMDSGFVEIRKVDVE